MTTQSDRTREERLPPALRLIRLSIKAASLLSGELGGRLVNRLWFGSRRFPEPAREREWLATAEWSTLAFQGRPLAVYAWGAGPVVLLVHGWHGRGAQLGAFVGPLVGAGFRVVTFDAPAHGRTPGRATNLPEVSAAVMAVAAAAGPLHGVVAHSFGAVCTLNAMALGLAPLRVVGVSAPSSIEFLMSSFGDRLDSPPAARAVHRRLMEERFGADVWQRFSPTRIARDVAVPALLIHDEDDRDVPWREGEALARAWPGTELVTTSGLGHRRILRDPQVIARAVDFMSAAQPSGSGAA